MSRLNSDILVVCFISRIAAILSGSAWIPFWSVMWTRNFSLDFSNSHLLGLTECGSCCFSALKHCSESNIMHFLVFPDTRTSSIKRSTPSRLESILLIRFWKCSGALDMPNGSLLKQYLPKGVMKVIGSCDFLARGICQNPRLASSLLKTLTPVSWASLVYFWQWMYLPENIYI